MNEKQDELEIAIQELLNEIVKQLRLKELCAWIENMIGGKR